MSDFYVQYSVTLTSIFYNILCCYFVMAILPHWFSYNFRRLGYVQNIQPHFSPKKKK